MDSSRVGRGFQQSGQGIPTEWRVDSSRVGSLLAVNYITGTNDTELL